jgi:hypothetical protein
MSSHLIVLRKINELVDTVNHLTFKVDSQEPITLKGKLAFIKHSLEEAIDWIKD